MVVRVTRASAAARMSEMIQLSSPPATPGPPANKKSMAVKAEPAAVLATPNKVLPATINNSKKRRRTSSIKIEDVNELPHNLGHPPDLLPQSLAAQTGSFAKKPRKSRNSAKRITVEDERVHQKGREVTTMSQPSPKKGKNNSYGLTPGQTPYPNWPHPTAAECEEVTRLLSTVHGQVKPPKTIPMPSLTTSGCGEVPSVLDALIRTRLSAATSGANSSRAFAGLVSKFGILKTGIGKGSVDWNKVRLADVKDIFEAIRSGGLADVKSKDIKKILQMVWEENQERSTALASSSNIIESSKVSAEEKNAEISKAEDNVLSLDHLHLMSNDDAFNALTKYPGIGPKTASCVLLFCLQRPSFAVDTHVFRLCKWLGWVPPPGDERGSVPGFKGKFVGPTRNSTYAHCEVRIPDHLKYPLHQLFIRHGKTCPRCRAITGESSEGWEKGCVIDHLVQRSGGRKSGGVSLAVKSSRKKALKKDDDESEAQSSDLSDLSDLGSDEEVDQLSYP